VTVLTGPFLMLYRGSTLSSSLYGITDHMSSVNPKDEEGNQLNTHSWLIPPYQG